MPTWTDNEQYFCVQTGSNEIEWEQTIFTVHERETNDYYSTWTRVNDIYSIWMRVNDIYRTFMRVNDIYSTRMRVNDIAII
jgi:(p)ppGpp synthase/HD superfamily hydrolase